MKQLHGKWPSVILMIALGLLASTGLAKTHWTLVAKLNAGGDAKEVTVGMVISKIRIVCTQEPVVINTVVIREGSGKDAHKVARTLKKGEEAVIELAQAKNVTGLRISDANRGTYEVYVEAAREPDKREEVKAGGKWILIQEVQAGGEAKELGVEGSISQIRIICSQGPVTINTIVLRNGAAKKAVTVASRFETNQERIIPLDAAENVTGLRISDVGKGRYEVYVK